MANNNLMKRILGTPFCDCVRQFDSSYSSIFLLVFDCCEGNGDSCDQGACVCPGCLEGTPPEQCVGVCSCNPGFGGQDCSIPGKNELSKLSTPFWKFPFVKASFKMGYFVKSCFHFPELQSWSNLIYDKIAKIYNQKRMDQSIRLSWALCPLASPCNH